VNFWTRPAVAADLHCWSLNPSVQVDESDGDVYWRYIEHGRLSLDFSASGQDATIESW
jgi:hypothetical protein